MVILMAKKSKVDPTTLAGALMCAAKTRRGEACTAAELKASLTTMAAAYHASKRSVRDLRERLDEAKDMVRNLLSRS